MQDSKARTSFIFFYLVKSTSVGAPMSGNSTSVLFMLHPFATHRLGWHIIDFKDFRNDFINLKGSVERVQNIFLILPIQNY